MECALTKFFSLIAACALLAACGDPLAKVDKLSSVELAEDVGIVGALPDPAEKARQGGLFSGLFGRDAKVEDPQFQSSTDAAVNAALGSVTAPTNDLAPAVTDVAPVIAPKKRGLFGFLRAKDEGQTLNAVASQPTSATAPAKVETIEAALAVEPEQRAVLTDAAPVGEEKPRRGLFGLLAGARAKVSTITSDTNVRTASIGPVNSANTQSKQSIFRSNKRAHKGPDVQIVPFGTSLAPGVVARVCDLPTGRLGKEIEKFPARGRGYKMFDSKPTSGGKRPFYVTGFDDRCARTFTAALAMFGSPTMHEQLRYGLPSKVQPYSTTDKAYEGIKRSVCGVGKKKACGAKINTLEKNTVFISIYDRIGSNAQWSNVLLHKGWVLATDRKG
jgi:hypothetical protein